MEELNKKIREEIELLKKMIIMNESKEKVEEQRKKLDELLEEYLKDFK